MTSRHTMEQALNTLYGKVFNEGRSELLAGLIAGRYVQHNPLFPDGPEPLIGYLQQAGTLPCEVRRMAIDGDLAFVHVRYPNWGGREHAAVDVFRFDEAGKIVEHWDVMQPVSDSSANANGMF